MFRDPKAPGSEEKRLAFIGSCTVMGDLNDLANAESILDMLEIPRLGAIPTRYTLASRVGAAQRNRWLQLLEDARSALAPSVVRHDLLGPEGQVRAALTMFMPFISGGRTCGVNVVVVDLRIPRLDDPSEQAVAGPGSIPWSVPQPRTHPATEPHGRQPAETGAAGSAGHLSTIVGRAVLPESASISVSDLTLPDAPLVFVNKAFEDLTGYTSDELMGRNCRLLQGPLTDPAAVTALREAITAGAVISTVLINYRRDGTTFLNQLNLAPIRAADGSVTHYVGYQVEVTT